MPSRNGQRRSENLDWRWSWNWNRSNSLKESKWLILKKHQLLLTDSMDGFSKIKAVKRARRPKAKTLLLFLFIIVSMLFLLQWLYSIPPPKFPSKASSACREDKEGFIFRESEVCTNTCGKVCFPRVHGICFGRSAVTICDEEQFRIHQMTLNEMRFHLQKPRQKVPVRSGSCNGWDTKKSKPVRAEAFLDENVGKRRRSFWISGLQMVADLTLMPHGKAGPNPHHESEKVIPAILMSQLYGLKNSTFHWFADPLDPSSISSWSKGLLKVFESEMKVRYLGSHFLSDEFPICFEDAVVFAGLTNAGYIPNVAAHDWLRKKVLGHCNIPLINAKKPMSNAVILHRPNSSRNIVNFDEMRTMLERELHIAVNIVEPGPRAFCRQVNLVADADLVVTPHGSHNVAALFMRPESIILEIFPLLYYIDWLGNLLHAGRSHHFEIYGTWSTERLGMPLLMRVYALLFGWNKCFAVRQCMNYGKTQNIYVDMEQLEELLHALASSCQLTGLASRCLSTNHTQKNRFLSLVFK